MPRHDLDTRDSAYADWVSAGCNAAETARALGIAETTVRYWAKVDRWRQRHAAEIFPVDRHEAHQLVGTNMMAAAIFASEQIRNHHDPEHSFEFRDKVQLDAAHGAVDRAGYGPVRVLQAPSITEEPKHEPALTADDLARLSPAQLRALEQGRSVTYMKQDQRDAIEVAPA